MPYANLFPSDYDYYEFLDELYDDSRYMDMMDEEYDRINSERMIGDYK